MRSVKVYYSDTYDPWFNLATEDWIFRDMDPSIPVLFLWRNQDTVVIGRFQNPWVECNLKQMETDEVKLARRQSGGGAVFHDLGNTNFTFMNSKEDYDKHLNLKLITNTLAKFDIEAMASGRNDILVDTKKISGSAFKENKDRCFHHGTLLINANLSRLQNYLNPDPKKLSSKGITSVKSRVMNLVEKREDFSHEIFCQSLEEEFCRHYQAEAEIIRLNHDNLEQIPELKNYYEKLKDWQWRYGETPKFDHRLDTRFEWGGVDVHLNSHKGLIKDIKIFSDSLHPEMIAELMKNLKEVAYNSDGVQRAIAKTKSELPMISDYLDEFEKWLISEIE
jgi:lipoate-protein ligase A